MAHALYSAESAARQHRRLGWALTLSLALHCALLAWKLPVFHTSSARSSVAIRARLAPLPLPVSPAPLALDQPASEPASTDIPETPQPAPVAPRAEPAAHNSDDSAYFRPGTLDVSPIPLGAIEPSYPLNPDDPDSRPLTGRLVLRVLINERGTVDKVIVEDAGSLPTPFSETAVAAFLAARFHPARRAGIPVRSQIRVEVGFGPEP